MSSASEPHLNRNLQNFTAVAALIGWAELLLQLWLTVGTVLGQGRGWPMARVIYFGFFTILTNLLATLALSAWRIGPSFPGHALHSRRQRAGDGEMAMRCPHDASPHRRARHPGKLQGGRFELPALREMSHGESYAHFSTRT
jgi:hypothetical protein